MTTIPQSNGYHPAASGDTYDPATEYVDTAGYAAGPNVVPEEDPWESIIRRAGEQLGVPLSDNELYEAQQVQSWAADFARIYAQRTDAPFDFLLAGGIIAESIAVGRRPVTSLSTGEVIPTIAAMFVADSSIYRKSTVMSKVRDMIESVDRAAVAPDEFSPQRLVTHMSEKDGQSVGLLRDEAGGLYDAWNKLDHQSGVKQILINFFDGRRYRKELQGSLIRSGDASKGDKGGGKKGKTQREPEIVEIREPFLSILLGTQRELFLDVASQGDIASGLLARFIYLVPEARRSRKEVRPMSREDEDNERTLSKVLQEIANQRRVTMKFASGVLDRWNHYQEAIEREIEQSAIPSIAGPLYSRHSEVALKLAIIFAYGNYDNDRIDRVETRHLLAGIAAAECWRRDGFELLSAIGPTSEEKRLQRAYDLILANPGIRRGKVMSHCRLSAKDMDAIEATLDQRDWIDVRGSKARGGKPATYYYPLKTDGPVKT